MAAPCLPPRWLSKITLPVVELSADRLYRISPFGSGEPHFGKTAGNRFDDRSRPKKRRFGTCYCGLNLEVAIAETILHDEIADHGTFRIAYSEFARRFLVRFRGKRLVLANLTGAALKTLGGDGSISTVLDGYDIPQRWAMAVHRHPNAVDGILYMSRHLNDRRAAVVFDRAAAKIERASYRPLSKVPRIHEAIASLHISFAY